MSGALPGTGWIDAARLIPVVEVVDRLSLHRRGSRFGPCPACGEEREGSSRRLPVGFSGSRPRWICNCCKVTGGPVDLAALVLCGKAEQLSPEEWDRVRAALLPGEGAAPGSPRPAWIPAAPAFPPVDRVRELWSRCLPLDSAGTGPARVREWLSGRSLPAAAGALELLRVAPFEVEDFPGLELLPGPPWIAVLPLVDSTGALRSLRFRSVDPAFSLKSRAPEGYSTGTVETGLSLACPMASALLSGRRADPTGYLWSGDLLLVEGEPDFIAALGIALELLSAGAFREGEAPAVLGWTGSGGLPLDMARRIPAGARVVIWTHPDPAGRKAAESSSARIHGPERLSLVPAPADLADCFRADPVLTSEAVLGAWRVTT